MDINKEIIKIGEELDIALKNSIFWPSVEWLKNELSKYSNIKLYVVGGTIRDFILETRNKIIDLDIMVENCPTLELLDKVRLKGGEIDKNMMGGAKWYPNPFISKTKERLELDIWRIEEGIVEGDPATIEAGISRFDLNINALAWDITDKKFYNPLKGLEVLLDNTKSTPMELLTEKIKPNNEARLILRAIKYSSKLGIPIGEKSKKWIKDNEKKLDTLPDEKIVYVMRAIDYLAIKNEISNLCDQLLSPFYSDRIKKVLFGN